VGISEGNQQKYVTSNRRTDCSKNRTRSGGKNTCQKTNGSKTEATQRMMKRGWRIFGRQLREKTAYEWDAKRGKGHEKGVEERKP